MWEKSSGSNGDGDLRIINPSIHDLEWNSLFYSVHPLRMNKIVIYSSLSVDTVNLASIFWIAFSSSSIALLRSRKN